MSNRLALGIFYRPRAARCISHPSSFLVCTAARFGEWHHSRVGAVKTEPHGENFPRSHLWVAEKNLNLGLSASRHALNLPKE